MALLDQLKGPSEEDIKKKVENILDTKTIPLEASDANSGDNCVICMDGLLAEPDEEGGEILLKTNCGHSFHRLCFKEWITKSI